MPRATNGTVGFVSCDTDSGPLVFSFIFREKVANKSTRVLKQYSEIFEGAETIYLWVSFY